MNRRTAIYSLATITGGMALFPACVDSLKLEITTGEKLFFNSNQSAWLEAISESVLPKGDLDLTTFESFTEFVSKMINFQKSGEQIDSFINGYNQCTKDIRKLYHSNIQMITPDQIVDYFSNIIEEELPQQFDPREEQNSIDKKYFCEEVRGLSIWHFTTSKEYQEEVLEFKMIPDPWEACVEH